MSLLKPESPEVLEKNISQIVAIAGDGRLKDDSDCSKELRQFIHAIEAKELFKHIEYCLNHPFGDSGLVLQDVVNELGRRLGYEVENGRYRGTGGRPGQDGIWKADDQTIIVEVKTTDVYSVGLDTIVGYKTRLIENGVVAKDASILLVVGRQGTGDLEAQIRGSRHAWEIRVISAKALCDLVRLKIESEEAETTKKIQAILRPIEYTRLDALIDIVFAAAQDRFDTDETGPEAFDTGEPEPGATAERQTWTEDIRKRAVRALGRREDVSLVRSTRAQFVAGDKKVRAVVLVSKLHENKKLWFAFFPRHLDFLKQAEKGFLLLAGDNREYCYTVEVKTLETILPKLNKVKGRSSPISFAWYIHVTRSDKIDIPHEPFDLKPYVLALDGGRH